MEHLKSWLLGPNDQTVDIGSESKGANVTVKLYNKREDIHSKLDSIVSQALKEKKKQEDEKTENEALFSNEVHLRLSSEIAAHDPKVVFYANSGRVSLQWTIPMRNLAEKYHIDDYHPIALESTVKWFQVNAPSVLDMKLQKVTRNQAIGVIDALYTKKT
jgi:hypothetical protein